MHETRMLSIISNCVEVIKSPKVFKNPYKKRKTLRRQMKMKEMNRNNNEVASL